MGDICPTDVQLIAGKLQVDEFAVTGELGVREIVSLSRGDPDRSTVYAGSTVKVGRGTARVTATGNKIKKILDCFLMGLCLCLLVCCLIIPFHPFVSPRFFFCCFYHHHRSTHSVWSRDAIGAGHPSGTSPQ